MSREAQSLYFYTVTDEDGTEYRAAIWAYQWVRVCHRLGVQRERIHRGAASTLPNWFERASTVSVSRGTPAGVQ